MSIIAHKDKHGRIYAFGRKEADRARSVANYIKFRLKHLGRKGATNEDKALYKLLKHGYETGTEGLLWLDKKYNQLLPFKTGTKSRVDISKEADRLLKKGTDSSIISIHNHPGSSVFSPEDLSVACKYTAIDTLQVVDHDGTRYYARIGGGKRPKLAEIRREFKRSVHKLKPLYYRLLKSGIDERTAWKEIITRVSCEVARIYGWVYERRLSK